MMRDEFADDDPQLEIEINDGGSRRIEAVIFADPEIGPLGFPRNIAQAIHNEQSALGLTITRLNRCTGLDGITIITPDEDRIRSLNLQSDLPLRVLGTDPTRFRNRASSIGKAARITSADTWRGSIAHMGCYDESLEPIALAEAMDEHNIDAAVIVGADWALLDPDTTDRVIARHRSDPTRTKVLFTQAVPGIAGCLLERSTVDGLVQAANGSSAMCSIGAMLSYIPIAPQGDPIASPLCVSIDPAVRDACVRAIADSTLRMQAVAAVYKGLGITRLKRTR